VIHSYDSPTNNPRFSAKSAIHSYDSPSNNPRFSAKSAIHSRL